MDRVEKSTRSEQLMRMMMSTRELNLTVSRHDQCGPNRDFIKDPGKYGKVHCQSEWQCIYSFDGRYCKELVVRSIDRMP